MRVPEEFLKHIPENCRNWSFLVIVLLVLSLIPPLVVGVVHGVWGTVFLSLVAIVFILLPFLVQAHTGFYLPRAFSFFLAFFVYGTLFLGEINRFYYSVWWWDLMLHFASAFAFGLIGLIVLVFSVSRKTLTAKPITLALFAFSFALMVGVLWEIFEYTGDQLFNMDMQKDGLHDTMGDFIINTAGALVAAGIGYFFLSPKKESPLDPVLEKVVEENT